MKDLHIHTKYSDGEYDEYEILEKIKQANITEFAICDHDTIEGSMKVYDILKKEKSSLSFHTGIELTCIVNGFKDKPVDIHLLVRDFDFNDKNINLFINQMSDFRKQKIKRMTDIVKETYNVDIKQNEIDEILKTTNSIGKPHIYKLLSRYGNYDREQYFTNMKKVKSSDLKLDAIKVIESLKDSTSITTLAHPIEIMGEYSFNYDDIDDLVKFLVNKGLKGLETRHSKHTENDAKIFSSIAKKYNLQESQGSDYHGPNVKPTVQLGVCEKR